MAEHKPGKDQLWYGAISNWDDETSLLTHAGRPLVGRWDWWQQEKWPDTVLVIVGAGAAAPEWMTLPEWHEAQGVPVPEHLR